MNGRELNATITGILGPMFAGKTTELLRLYNETPEKKRFLFKPEIDNRYDISSVVSHDGEKAEAIILPNIRDIVKYTNKMPPGSTVFLDEAQFYDGKLIDICTFMAFYGQNVVYSALDMDFLGKAFKLKDSDNTIEDLLVFTHNKIYKTADCAVCDSPAPYTFRTSADKGLVSVGGAEAYEPRCKKHFVYK